MLANLQAQYIQAFLGYKSKDGTLGVTNLTAGIQFKNGLYVGGTFSAASLPISPDNVTINGVGGNGYIQFAAQTVQPSLAPANIYADTAGRIALGHSGTNTYAIIIDNSLMAATRTFNAPNKSGTWALVGDNLSSFVNDSGFVVGPGSAVSGRLPSFNGTTGKLIQDSGIGIAGTSGKTLTVSNSIGLAGVDGKILTLNQNLTLDGTSGKALTLTGTLTIGADASITGGGTLALGGKTLTVNQNLTLDGTSGKSLVLTGGLTIGADTSVSGGGTVVLGGFIFTVPATGTAALLGANNIFTGINSFSAASPIVSFVDSGGVTATVGSSGGFTGFSGNRNVATGTIYDASKTAAVVAVNTSNGSSYAFMSTSQVNNTSPTIRLKVLNGVNIGGGTIDPGMGNLILEQSTANLFLKDGLTGFQVATTGILTPQSGNSFRTTAFTSGVNGWNVSDAGNAEFNNVRVRGELAASVFKVSEISATAGTFGVFYSAAALNADCTTPASISSSFTFDAKNSDAGGMLFAVNDVVRFKSWTGSAISDSWATITARTTHSTYTTYTATLNSGSTSATFRAGTAVVDYGPSGTGFITLSADGTIGSSPNLTMATHAGSPWSAQTTLSRLGNLNGSYDYATDIYGLGMGQYGAASKSWLTIDQTNGFRIGNNTSTLAQWDTAGTILLGQTGAGNNNITIDSTNGFRVRNNTTVVTQLDTSGNATFGQVATNKANVYWNSSNSRLEFRGGTSGTSVQTYIHTDGSVVLLADNSQPGSNLRWRTSGGTSDVANVQGYLSGTSGLIYVGSTATGTGGDAETTLQAINSAGNIAYLRLYAYGSAMSPASTGFVTMYSPGGLTFAGMSVGSNSVPSYMLDVDGGSVNDAAGSFKGSGSVTGLYLNNTASGGRKWALFAGATGSTPGTSFAIFDSTAGAYRMFLSSAGNFRFNAYGAGTLVTDASGNITASSDEKLKIIKGNFTKGLAALRNLKPIRYRWRKDSGFDRSQEYVGFGARHTKLHIPEAVGKGKDGFHTMSDRVILATVVNAIKELDQRYASLQRT